MRISLRAIATVAIALAVSLTPQVASPAAAASAQKVVIIVGPTRSLTSHYRDTGNQIATAAAADGAEVVKVYSPKATWNRVKSAVEGANIIIYLGHGNGYPNPYTSGYEYTDRVNGWGLNRTTTNGDDDNWETTMVYCGEKALLGTLTSSDGASQWKKCGGSAGTQGINPAPNFVMIYNDACYAPGASEGWDTPATESQALQRVRNYSYPMLALGAGAYFATDMYRGASQLVDQILTSPDMAFGEIAMDANGFDAAAQQRSEHPDVAGDEIWIQGATAESDAYRLAYAGEPTRTPAGGTAALPDMPDVAKIRPAPSSKWAKAGARVRVWFTTAVDGVSRKTLRLFDDYGFLVPAGVRYNAAQHKAVLIPRSPLQPTTWYRVELESGITADSSGMGLAARTWSFRTGSFEGDGSVMTWPATAALSFSGGVHTGYRFNAYGKPTATKVSTLGGSSSAATSTRRQLRGQSGWWYYVTNGVWAGYWLHESSALYLSGSPPPSTGADAPATYDPSATLTIARGTHTGYSFSAAGDMTAGKTATFAGTVSASTTSLELVPNQGGSWFRVVSGPFDGYWLRASDVVFVEPPGS